MLELLAKLIKILNAEIAPWQISAGFIFGMILGLTPLFSFSNLIVLLLLLVLRINLTAALLSLVLFSGIGYLLDPIMESLGASLLAHPSLLTFWSGLYQIDFWRLIQFNNTLQLGSTLLALCLALPLFFISNYLIRTYRENILSWVRKSRLMTLYKASKLYHAYNKVSGGESL